MTFVTQTSKYIELVLSFKPKTVGITLDEHGWADVKELISGIITSGNRYLDQELLEEIVRTDDIGFSY